MALLNNCYNLSGEKHALIFVNSAYASPEDETRTAETLATLNFRVSTHKDLSCAQILELLRCYAAGDTKTACLFVVMLTNGTTTNNMVHTADGSWPLSKIIDCLDGEALADTPKVFIVQASKGEKMDTPSTATGWARYFNRSSASRPSNPFSFGADPLPFETIVVYASAEGSYYDGGSPFIRELCDALERDAGRLHFLSIMTNVQGAVARYPTIQIPSTRTNATKQLMLQ